MSQQNDILSDLNDRSREVFRRVVEGYLETGDPVGSRTLTRELSERVSAATIRNVMQDLEFLGLLDSPHISAGRVPTPHRLHSRQVSHLFFPDPCDQDPAPPAARPRTSEGPVAWARDRR